MSSSWNDRIKNLEVTPPAGGWEKLAASLDESLNGHPFPVNLFNAESEPPAATWDKIQSALEAGQAPVVPLRKRNAVPRWVRFAVAASLLGFLSFAAVKFFNTNKINVAAAVDGSRPVSNDSLIPAGPVQNSSAETPPQSQEERDEKALEQSKQVYAKLDLRSHGIAGRINRRLYHSPAQLSEESTAAFLQKDPELQYSHRAAVNDSQNDADRYLMFRDSEGRFIRISKKMTNLYCCVSGEEQDANCTDQLKKWREKIASSSFVPSPDNFMDILDLVNSLQDNRN